MNNKGLFSFGYVVLGLALVLPVLGFFALQLTSSMLVGQVSNFWLHTNQSPQNYGALDIHKSRKSGFYHKTTDPEIYPQQPEIGIVEVK